MVLRTTQDQVLAQNVLTSGFDRHPQGVAIARPHGPLPVIGALADHARRNGTRAVGGAVAQHGARAAGR